MKEEFNTVNLSDMHVYLKSEGNEKNYYVEGFIIDDEVDSDSEMVPVSTQDAMVADMKSRVIKLDVEHERFLKDPTTKPIAKIVDAKRVNVDGVSKIHVKCVLNTARKDFKSVWKELKSGMLDAFSIAYNKIKTHVEQVGSKTVKILDEIDILNVTITGTPVNRGATISKAYMKSVQSKNFDIGVKTMKRNVNLKSEYKGEDDGNHVHDESNIMGVHRHKYLEQEIKRLNDRIWELSDKFYELKSDTCKDEPYAKSISSKKDVNLKSGGNKMADKEVKKDPAPEAGNDNPAVDKKVETVETKVEDKPKTEPEKEVETKSVNPELVSLKSEMANLKKTNVELKAQIDKLMSKPQLKSVVEQPANNAEQETNLTPLSMIR